MSGVSRSGPMAQCINALKSSLARYGLRQLCVKLRYVYIALRWSDAVYNLTINKLSKLFSKIEVLLLIMEYLSIREVREIGLVCRVTHAVARSVLEWRNDVGRFLSRFFSIDRTPYFRNVIRATNALVGGSAVLQIFAQQTFRNSDIDIFVRRRHASDFIAALDLGLGCRRVPTCKNSRSANLLLYFAYNIEEIVDFASPTGCIIKVIVTYRMPIETILSHHSSYI